MAAVLSNEPINVETDASRCALGRFLNEYHGANSMETDIMEKLKPVHKELHETVHLLQELITNNADPVEIEEMRQRRLEPVFQKVEELMESWTKAV